MRQTLLRATIAAALLLASAAHAIPHGGNTSADMDMDMDMSSSHGEHSLPATDTVADESPLSYFAYNEHTGVILAHIILMIIAWCFVLPVAVMLSVARSRYTIPSQCLFLIVNGVGLFLGIVYNAQTPDLYENNAHHKIGWIATWVVVAQVVMGIIYTYSGKHLANKADGYERAAFLPVSSQNMMHHQGTYPSGPLHEYRWSGDSGQGTERNSSSLHSRPSTPGGEERIAKPEIPVEPEEPESPSTWFHNSTVDRFFAIRLAKLVPSRISRVLRVIYMVIDRLILQLGFVAIATGGVTYGGVFRGIGIFSGLAHFIKGGIFFWYGLVVLGRFMGCWADLGWSWNMKPPQSVVGKAKFRAPTGEFVESMLIFIYGSTNVFLEHLGSWGGEWSAQDLEHVSISVMFFGAGLCGMLIESNRVKDWLHSTIFRQPAHLNRPGHREASWDRTNNVSLNPMPALIIFLLGVMMGSHHQQAMVSTMMHRQWGTLLAGGAMARAVTYILLYIKPPTSFFPSRPPSELVGAFCLISGGLIFMLSASDIIDAIIYYDLDAMFIFNIAVGFTCFLMAWEFIVIAIKAWAAKKDTSRTVPQFTAPSWLPAQEA